MAIGLLVSIRNARLDLIRTAIDAGPGPGQLKLYTATRPATGAAITTQTLLAELTFADPCAPAAAAGVLTFNVLTDDVSANASGTAVWARVTDSTGAFVCDMSVTATGGGGDIEIDDTAIVLGGEIDVTSATLTEGNA